MFCLGVSRGYMRKLASDDVFPKIDRWNNPTSSRDAQNVEATPSYSVQAHQCLAVFSA